MLIVIYREQLTIKILAKGAHMSEQADNLDVISTESDLITRLKAGDHQAFEGLIRNYNQ